jgi:glycosyltransferase involved in cell wall biosynthesis
MKVGFDATSLTLRRSGIGRYTLELLRALHEHEPSIELLLMAHKAVDFSSTGGGLSSLPTLGRPSFPVKLAWMQAVLPMRIGRRRVDLCHFTNYHAPLMLGVPYVVNIHDMSLIVMPEGHPRKRVVTMRPLLRAIARRSAAVLSLTESARQDTIQFLDVDPDKVHVVPAAAAPGFGPITDEARLSAAAERYGVEPGFLLFVGTIEPRKNLPRLIQAYAQLRREGFSGQLVICGGRGWKSPDVRETVERLELGESVVFTGYVPDDDLVALLNLCRAFTYPSLYEGYGLPIIEALACGAPTVTSNRGATAEVAGNAALLVAPEDVDALKSALAVALHDEPTRARLRAAGFERAAQFTWARAAHETAAIYRWVAEARA